MPSPPNFFLNNSLHGRAIDLGNFVKAINQWIRRHRLGQTRFQWVVGQSLSNSESSDNFSACNNRGCIDRKTVLTVEGRRQKTSTDTAFATRETSILFMFGVEQSGQFALTWQDPWYQVTWWWRQEKVRLL
jgi:hypothetical protein